MDNHKIPRKYFSYRKRHIKNKINSNAFNKYIRILSNRKTTIKLRIKTLTHL